MKIVIDTQILYHISGISINNKIEDAALNKVIQENEIYLTSTSIMEAVVKFRNDLDMMKKALKPQLDADGILQSKVILRDQIIPVMKLRKIYYAGRLKYVKDDIYDIFVKKIKLEAENARFFLYLLIISFMFLLEKDTEDSDDTIARLNIYKDQLLEKAQPIYDQFYNTLFQGYMNDDVETVIKEEFGKQFQFFSELFIAMQVCGLNQRELEGFEEKQVHNLIKEKMESNKLYKRIERGIRSQQENPMEVFNYREYQQKLDYLMETYFKLYFSIKVKNKIYRDFISYKIGKFLFDNAKFKKNDILDMIIMGTIDLEAETNNLHIITIDKANVQFLRSINHPSVSLIESILKEE